MGYKGINTLSRFLFLNTYAFLLVFIGMGIGVLPMYSLSLWLIVPQTIGVIVCLRGAFRIFASWGQKKREYLILIRKNEQGICPGSFSDYMQAPCGRLLTILVLKDLDRRSSYKDLKKLQRPFMDRLKEGCRGQETVVTVYKQNQ